MNKCQILRIIENKDVTLQGSDIANLMLNGQEEKGKNILKQLEYKTLDQYIANIKQQPSEKLEVSEVGSNFIWYLFGSGHKAEEIMKNAEEWKEDLVKILKQLEPAQAEKLQKVINEVMC